MLSIILSVLSAKKGMEMRLLAVIFLFVVILLVLFGILISQGMWIFGEEGALNNLPFG